ncbi:thioesterase II family protein [Streptomyces sp. AK02-01A]|uniref:thioesterase II family protein n=1 Tax=Streptomyces sp. AK02-01A TaxID=3028648 RepID=UPI0029AE4CFF|nr:alpha/beta fold hydrolase [Streptomyces sp. AK02-01A]MDX3854289.1 alpha/beta fold hydrolase [Streptomyces sp. AK02-01A]
MRQIPVLCFPFAGAGASAFRRCQEYGSDTVLISPVQLPGREERFGEPLYTDVVAAVDDLLPTVLDQIAGSPVVALFGHSLGAVMAYEMAHRINGLGMPRVVRLFVSGSPGPWTQRESRATGLTDDGFLEQVREFAGYTHPALEHPELREMLLPTLRADVEMHENYRAPSEKPLPVPIVSIRGADDELVSRAQAAEWESATSAGCRQAEVPGGHMYVTDSPGELVRLMDEELAAQGAGR